MNGEGPRILGIHLEGPSSRPDVSARILPWRAGIPIRSLLERLLESGRIRLLTLRRSSKAQMS